MKHYSAAALQRLTIPQLLEELDLVAKIRAQLDGTSAGKANLARRLGLSEGTLSRILRGQLPVSDQVAERLGFRPVTRFERIS